MNSEKKEINREPAEENPLELLGSMSLAPPQSEGTNQDIISQDPPEMVGLSYFEERVMRGNPIISDSGTPIFNQETNPKVILLSGSGNFANEMAAAVITIENEEKRSITKFGEETTEEGTLSGKFSNTEETQEDSLGHSLTVNLSKPEPLEESKELLPKNKVNSPRGSKVIPVDIQSPDMKGEKVVGINLLEGEHIKLNTEANFVGNGNYRGKIIMTNYQLRFAPIEKKFYKAQEYPKDYYICPLGIVKKVEKYVDKKASKNIFIEISTKDMRNYKFSFLPEFPHNPSDIYMQMCKYIFPTHLENVFAFNHKHSDIYKFEGWNLYNDLKEYERMGLDFDNEESNFQLFFSNIEGEVCQTYPQRLILPKNLSPEDIERCAQFRTKSRFPALTWYNKRNGTSVWRSAQIKEGIKGNKSDADIYMLRNIIETLPIKNPIISPRIARNYDAKWAQAKLHIYDARPYWNALANRVVGGGFEKDYPDTYMHFCKIENIHKVRDAYMKVLSLRVSGTVNSKWMAHLESSGWLQLLSTILTATNNIVDSIKGGKVALIHCSDGWDRTSILVGLSTLLLDKYYRTMEGFEILIEKDWLSFGHQFSKRIGHIQRTTRDEQQSPIFIQFLDSVYQIMRQFPTIFQFNNKFLVKLAVHCSSHKYGTFLFNCDRDRRMHNLKGKTISIWSYINTNKQLYINPFYEPTNKGIHLRPDTNYMKLSLWEEYFLKWSKCQIKQYSNSASSQNHLDILMKNEQDKSELLERQNKILRKKTEIAENKLREKGVIMAWEIELGEEDELFIAERKEETNEDNREDVKFNLVVSGENKETVTENDRLLKEFVMA